MFYHLKAFLIKLGLFILLILILSLAGAFITSIIVKHRYFTKYNVESNLLYLEENQHYDILLMGISHAQNFSRNGNLLRVEKILNKKIINIGQGEATCGVNEQLFYFHFLTKKGITYDTIIYIVSPPMIYADYLNRASNTFIREPFRIDFLISYLQFQADNKFQRTQNYIYSKLHPEWIRLKPDTSFINQGELSAIDSSQIKKGFEDAYLDGLNQNIFKKNCETLEKTIIYAQDRNSSVIFIIPPALFGKWKGHEETIQFCQQMKRQYGIQYFDYSESVMTPNYYYDHHHLNSKGVSYFTLTVLKPIL